MKGKILKRLLSVMLSLLLMLSLIPTAVSAESLYAGDTIYAVNMDLVEPVPGSNSEYAVLSSSSSNVNIYAYEWYKDGVLMPFYDEFEEDTTYTLKARLTTLKTFSSNVEVYVNGQPAQLLRIEQNSTHLLFSFDYYVPKNSYSVSFIANGGYGTMNALTGVNTFTMPECGFTAPEGKFFAYWEDIASDAKFYPGDVVTIYEDLIVRAVWQGLTYTITFDANGGSGSMDPLTGDKNYVLPECGFTAPAGKQFKWWYIVEYGSVYDAGDNINISRDITARAIWEDIPQDSGKIKVNNITATSDIDSIVGLYKPLKLPEFTLTDGVPAVILSGSGNLQWQKKVDGEWKYMTDVEVRFTPGEWRISTQVRIDGDSAKTYELGNPVTLTVDGVKWNMDNNGIPHVYSDYSMISVTSPVFEVKDDPNIKPPVEITQLNIDLEGYYAGAKVADAKLSCSNSNVTFENLNFLLGVDTNGDGELDAATPAGTYFEDGKIYAVSFLIKAKPGYSIMGLVMKDIYFSEGMVIGSYSDENDAFSCFCELKKPEKIKIAAPKIKSSNVESSGKIKLTWDKVEGAVKYQVYRATSKNGKYGIMKTVTGGTSYINANAVPGKYYYYYVIAVDSVGNKSAKSNIAGRTCDYAQPVVTATNDAATGKPKLTWKAVEGATSYKVYRAATKNGSYTLMKTVKDGTTYINANAATGKLYYYKVKAYGPNSSATSVYSVVDSRTCDLKRPVVSITTSSGKPKISWAAVTGAKEYKIYRATSKNGTYKEVKTTTSKSWKDTTAKKGQTYYYKVVAVHSKSAANSANSVVKSIKCTK